MSESAPAPVIDVVDDDASFRTAVSRLLRAAHYEVRPYASAGAYLMAERREGPGCLLLDLRMPGPGGLELQAALARREDPPPIVFLTAHGDVPLSVRAMKAGAHDFLTKPVRRETLLAAVAAALARDAGQRTERRERRALQECYDGLKPREREVFGLVVAGRLNKQIASRLGSSERTVKAYRARVMRKMRAGSVADLVRSAVRLGLPVAI